MESQVQFILRVLLDPNNESSFQASGNASMNTNTIVNSYNLGSKWKIISVIVFRLVTTYVKYTEKSMKTRPHCRPSRVMVALLFIPSRTTEVLLTNSTSPGISGLTLHVIFTCACERNNAGLKFGRNYISFQ